MRQVTSNILLSLANGRLQSVINTGEKREGKEEKRDGDTLEVCVPFCLFGIISKPSNDLPSSEILKNEGEAPPSMRPGRPYGVRVALDFSWERTGKTMQLSSLMRMNPIRCALAFGKTHQGLHGFKWSLRQLARQSPRRMSGVATNSKQQRSTTSTVNSVQR